MPKYNGRYMTSDYISTYTVFYGSFMVAKGIS